MMRDLKRKLALCAMALLLTLPMLSSLGSAIAVADGAAAEYPITYGTGVSYESPKIDGNRIVYTLGGNLYVYDATSKQKRQLTMSGQAYSPEISGNEVVWVENRGGTNDIFLYDLIANEETQITQTSSVYEVTPMFAGTEQQYIVYGAGRGIYLHDRVSQTTQKINTVEDSDYSVQNEYAVSGNRVVWSEYRYNPVSMSMHLYTIGGDGSAVPIAQDANLAVSQPNLAIDGDKLVWVDRQTGSNRSNIYLYDLAAESGRFLDPQDTNQSAPAIDGGQVVWLDNRNGKSQVYRYDLATASAVSVTSSDTSKSGIDLSGSTVVWGNGKNIYANADIGPSPIEALNQAASAEELRDLLVTAAIGLTSPEDYASWENLKDKGFVADQVWSSRPAQGFASLTDVQAAFDGAVQERLPIARVHAARQNTALTEALNSPALGLDLSSYQALDPKDRAAAVQTFAVNNSSSGFDAVEQIQWALDEAVLAWSTSNFHYVDDMDMNGWFGDLAADSQGRLYVVYQDEDHDEKATVRRYDQSSGSWLVVGGSGFSSAGASSIRLAFDSNDTPYVAFSDQGQGSKATVMKFNGTAWETMGQAGFTAGNHPFFLNLAIGAGNVPYVAYSETGAGGRGHVLKFDGTNWVQAASNNPLSGGARFIHLELDSAGTPYIGFSATVNMSSQAKVMKLDGTTWQNVGTPNASLNPYYMDFAIGDDDALYIDMIVSSQYVVFTYNGSEWVGLEQDRTLDVLAQHSLTVQGKTIYVTFPQRDDSNRATIMKLEDGVWKTVETTGFTDVSADGDDSKMVLVDDTLYYGFLVRGGHRGNLTSVMANHLLDSTPTYTIGAIEDVELPELSEGYLPSEQQATSIAIKKTGTGVLTNVTAELSGDQASAFELTQPALDTLQKFKPMTPITVKPIAGHAAGTYTATVTVTADQAEAVSLIITQTVLPSSGGHIVTYDAGASGAIDGAASEEVLTGAYPSAVPTVLASKGYAFVGWSKDGGATKLSAQEVSAMPVTGAVTYTAHYILMGDANGDGKVTNADALLLTKFIKGLTTLTAEQKLAVDMNGDQQWDAIDIQMILALCVGKGGQTNG